MPRVAAGILEASDRLPVNNSLELVRAGRTPEELSREFEPTAQSIRNWVGQADLAAALAEPPRTSPGDGPPELPPAPG